MVKPHFPTEHEEQVVFFAAVPHLLPRSVRHLELLVFANPNGELRQPRFNSKGQRYCLAGQRLAAEGVKKGVLDIFCMIPWGGYPGLVIEMKRQRLYYGKTQKSWDKAVTPEQREYLDALTAAGYMARVAYGTDEAIEIFKEYFKK